MSKERGLTIDFVRRALDYSPETGDFTWKVRPASDFATERAHRIYQVTFEGQPAFTGKAKNGYRCTRLCGVLLYAHRTAFAIMMGAWPEAQVDHIDGDRENNRWCNLRPATQAINSCNSAMRSDNSSGIVGVSFDGRRGRWVAQGRFGGRQFNLGRFASADEAVAARRAFEREHGFHPNHGRVRA